MIAAVAGLSLVTIPTATAAPQAGISASTLTCNTAVNVSYVAPDGNLFLLPHNEPENGNYDWGQKIQIGNDWAGGRTLAGPGGVVYSMRGDTGELRRFRWNGAGWDSFNGALYRVVGSGWARYAEAAHRNKVTVDEKGRLYEVGPDGNLDVFIWEGDDATGGWTAETGSGKPIDTGWDQYDLIVAAGDGVIYARKPNGHLFRFRYHAESHRFTQYGLHVGVGWEMFNRVFSAGGDILYGTTRNTRDELLWYRYFEDTNTWAGSTGKLVGDGWYGEVDVIADTNGCRLSGYPTPTRPAVPQRFDAPNTVVQGQDNKVTFFYVNSAAGLTAAKQRFVDDYTSLAYQTFPEYHRFTGQPGAGIREDGRLEVLANSHDDAAYRGKTQEVKDGVWGTNNLGVQGGWMQGDPIVVAEADKTLTTYAFDNGVLYRRSQAGINAGHTAWRSIGTGLTADFSVVRNQSATDIVARFPDQTVRTARFANGALGPWRTIGSDAVGRPAAVAHLNGSLQVFTRRPDGKIYTQLESSGSFPGTWQKVANDDFIGAAGSPAAVLRSGMVELAVRGTDGYVHQSSQVAPAGGFNRWDVKLHEDSVTDPTGAVLSNGTPIFTWRSAQGLINTVWVPDSARPEFRSATARR